MSDFDSRRYSQARREQVEVDYLEFEQASQGLRNPSEQEERRLKYNYELPKEFEDYFRQFDDRLIYYIQYYTPDKPGWKNLIIGNFLKYLCMFFNFFTLIEYGQAYALFFQLISQDYLSKYYLIFGFVSAFFSQIPKRFLWRKRPYAADRAVELAKYNTSAFPSRAVVCSTVYTLTIFLTINYYNNLQNNTNDTYGMGKLLLVMILGLIISSFARIYLGAHYPSDCLGGLLLGFVIILVSFIVMQFPDPNGCITCYYNKCYAKEEEYLMDGKHFQIQNITQVIINACLVFLIFLALAAPPLKFWNKSASIFGTFLAVYCAGLIMACRTDTQRKTFYYYGPEEVSGLNIFLALGISFANIGLSLLSGKVTKKSLNDKQVLLAEAIIFWLFFAIFLSVILVFRLYAFH